MKPLAKLLIALLSVSLSALALQPGARIYDPNTGTGIFVDPGSGPVVTILEIECPNKNARVLEVVAMIRTPFATIPQHHFVPMVDTQGVPFRVGRRDNRLRMTLPVAVDLVQEILITEYSRPAVSSFK